MAPPSGHAPAAPPRLAAAQREAAPEWLARLPALTERTVARWRLTVERVVEPGGRDGLVVLVRDAGGGPAALKLVPPGPAAAWEAAALRRWDGHGAVRLWRTAPVDGALLLERAHAAVSLRSLPAERAMLEAASAVRRLWVPPGGTRFPTVADRTRRQVDTMRDARVPEAAPLVREAVELRDRLVADAPAESLLHGDFRQGAVLASDAGRMRWLAAGPDPLVGEPAYDVARLARDRLPDLMASPGAAAVTRRRLARLAADLEVDQERLRAWTFFRAVESGLRQVRAGRLGAGEALLEFATWL